VRRPMRRAFDTAVRTKPLARRTRALCTFNVGERRCRGAAEGGAGAQKVRGRVGKLAEQPKVARERWERAIRRDWFGGKAQGCGAW